MFSTLSRRRMLALSSAAALGATFFDAPRILMAADDAFGGFPVWCQSCWRRNSDLAGAVRHLQGLGLPHVELYSKHLAVDAMGDALAATKKLLASADIAISAHGVNGFSKDHEANQKLF